MPLYEFSDDLGNRHRRDVEDLTQLPDGVTVTGRVFGALADGSGGFVTDGATFDTLTKIIKAVQQQQTPPDSPPPPPTARPEAQYPPLPGDAPQGA
jgi:hypothetical protein